MVIAVNSICRIKMTINVFLSLLLCSCSIYLFKKITHSLSLLWTWHFFSVGFFGGETIKLRRNSKALSIRCEIGVINSTQLWKCIIKNLFWIIKGVHELSSTITSQFILRSHNKNCLLKSVRYAAKKRNKTCHPIITWSFQCSRTMQMHT